MNWLGLSEKLGMSLERAMREISDAEFVLRVAREEKLRERREQERRNMSDGGFG